MNEDDENRTSDRPAPVWKLLTPEEIEEVRAFLDLAERNRARLKNRWQKAFVRSIGEMVRASGDETRLSVAQLATVARMRKILTPPAGDPEKIAIASAALEVLEQEVSRIETEMMLLNKLRVLRLRQVKEKLSQVQGGWAFADFAERLMQTYWNFPNLAVADLLGLFSPNLKNITQIPQEYRRMPSGAVCELCEGEIYVSSRSATFKTAADPQTGHRVRVCDTCEYEQQSVVVYDHNEGVVKHYRGSKLLETYSMDDPGPALSADDELIHSQSGRDGWLAEPSRSQREVELGRMSYRQYLQSSEWLEIRDRAYARAGYKCQVCGKGGKLNVHHNNYPPRGTETPRDLLVMCEPCHGKFHDVMPPPEDSRLD